MVESGRSIVVVVILRSLVVVIIGWVPVATLEQLLTIVNTNLLQHTAGPEYIGVVPRIMPVDHLQHIEVFHTFVDCFLSAPNSRLHELSLFRSSQMSWDFTVSRALSTIATISLDSLVLV